MGHLVETAIFAQWFHAEIPIYYARWSKGEVDIVGLGGERDVHWAVEAKWSDRYYEHPEELRALATFCRKHQLADGLVTTRTVSGYRDIGPTSVSFEPASLYCYKLGYNIVGAKAFSLRRVGTSAPEPKEIRDRRS
jgi:hypothetical protein